INKTFERQETYFKKQKDFYKKSCILLQLVDDNSKEISMALADDTTHKFLSLLSEKPMTLTEICAKLTRFEGDMFKFIRIYYLYSFDKFIF
ncbi:MAG: hypothetical protein GW904_06595, partial [Candidatus Altiarchaeum hamiconexum]|nr:hypothetical protein [Candidatus Altarchaeum hamiconexum]